MFEPYDVSFLVGMPEQEAATRVSQLRPPPPAVRWVKEGRAHDLALFPHRLTIIVVESRIHAAYWT